MTTQDMHEIATELVQFERSIARGEAALVAFRQKRDELRERLAKAMIDEGMVQVKTKGGQTFSIRKEIQVNKRKEFSTEEACRLLKAAGLGEFVQPSYQPTTLKAYVVELDKRLQDERPGESVSTVLPACFKDAFNIWETHTVRCYHLNEGAPSESSSEPITQGAGNP